MSMIDYDRLHEMYGVMRSKEQMKLIRHMYKSNPYKYSQLREYLALGQEKSDSGKFAYHLRKLLIRNLVKKQEGYYFLTRAGIALLDLLIKFEKKCMKYEITECEADGTIKHFVKRDS